MHPSAPSTILKAVSHIWTYKLVDLGLASVVDPAVASLSMRSDTSSFSTPDRDVLSDPEDGLRRYGLGGTVKYMSPEAFGGATGPTSGAALTYAADIWSLGVTLFEMVTGQLPFKPAVHSIGSCAWAISIADLESRAPLVLDRMDSDRRAR